MRRGSNSKAPKTAAAMAKTVSSPKYMLGLKFDNVKVENPMITVNVV
tara:strand:+ start:561 stop:701 length:141 start_codon:yes stop_codon:yes gene_type:complete